MNDSQRDAIIDDLLRKRPYGPKGKKNSDNVYHETDEYCYERHGYRKTLKCEQEHFGYDPKTIFCLGLHDDSATKNYIHNRWFKGKSSWEIGRKKSTITRRANRIWNRISAAISHVKQNGGKGIYSIGKQYGPDRLLGYVHAETPEEANILASTFFPRADYNYQARFVEFGNATRLISRNKELTEGFEQKADRLAQDIENSQKQIVALKNHMSMLQTLEGHQLALDTEACIEEE